MSMTRLNPNAGLLVQRGTFVTPTDLSSVTVNFPQAYSDVPCVLAQEVFWVSESGQEQPHVLQVSKLSALIKGFRAGATVHWVAVGAG